MSTRKKDNTTLRQKVRLRLNALAEVEHPRIVETHGGWGRVHARCYAGIGGGVVFETDAEKAAALARTYPTWAVYRNDCVRALAAGVGFGIQPNFFDVDPYGECWPVIDAILAGMEGTAPPARWVLVVNDGLRQKLRMQGGWSAKSMAGACAEFGNENLFSRYLDVCRWLVTTRVQAAGYALRKWAGYYCGHGGNMTHFAAVLER